MKVRIGGEMEPVYSTSVNACVEGTLCPLPDAKSCLAVGTGSGRIKHAKSGISGSYNTYRLRRPLFTFGTHDNAGESSQKLIEHVYTFGETILT